MKLINLIIRTSVIIFTIFQFIIILIFDIKELRVKYIQLMSFKKGDYYESSYNINISKD